ncbi:MAG: CheR family methyltransferase [Planctomycetota bacterium]|jgi:chemotaxis protein methyltransferase CheR
MNQPSNFQRLASLLHRRCGILLQEEKHYLIEQRLSPLLRAYQLDSWQALEAAIDNGSDEALIDDAIHAITTHETSFFRDEHPFTTIADVLLPEIGSRIRERKSRSYLRRGPQASIWCAAASCGQEPFSLAMLFEEFLHTHHALGIDHGDLVIHATDISNDTLAQAIAGEYSSAEINRGINDSRRAAFFTPHGADRWRIKDRTRSLVQFSTLNLCEDFTHFGAFDAILCRNVLIYFDEQQRRTILDSFSKMLDPGAVLILGSSENILPAHPAFTPERIGRTLWYRRNA